MVYIIFTNISFLIHPGYLLNALPPHPKSSIMYNMLATEEARHVDNQC